MASAEAIEAAEGLLADSYEAAALWLSEGLVQIEENDRKRERGETPRPCPLELFRAGVRHFSDVALMGAVEALLTSKPDLYSGNRNFLGLIRQHAEPIQVRHDREREAATLTARQARPALPSGRKAPEHGDGEHVYQTWTKADGTTATMRDTVADNRAAFGAMQGAAAKVAAARADGKFKGSRLFDPQREFACVCSKRYRTRDELERHTVVHYPPGAMAFHAKRLGLDLEAVKREARPLWRR